MCHVSARCPRSVDCPSAEHALQLSGGLRAPCHAPSGSICFAVVKAGGMRKAFLNFSAIGTTWP